MMAIVVTSNVACTVQQAATPIESSEPATPQEASATIAPSKVSPTAKPTPTNTPLPDPLPTDLEPFVATKAPVLPAATLTPALPKITAIPTETPEPYRASIATYSPEDSTGHEDGVFGTGYSDRQRDCVSDPSPLLTSHIPDLSTIGSIQPPSVISGNWYKNRSYLNIAAEHGAVARTVPVYAPENATLTGITYYLQPMNDIDGNLIDVPQYEVRLQISCEVTYGFDHLTELGPGIAELAPTEPSTSTRDAEKSVSIEVNARDILGYTTGTIVAHSWDFIFSNTAVVNSFANQERYKNTGDLKVLLYAECPYEYFADDLGDEYRALIGGSSGSSSDSVCHTSYDVPDGIYGGWFQTPFDDEDPFARADWGMAIATMPDGAIRVNGESNAVRLRPGDETYLDPRTVADEHCYASARGMGGQEEWHVYLKMLTPGTMGVAFGQGSCPKSLPADHIVYYR